MITLCTRFDQIFEDFSRFSSRRESVFLTRRAVSLAAGLWFQHSTMSLPIDLRYCDKKEFKIHLQV